MAADPDGAVQVDPGDFDAVAVLGDVVVSLRAHALEHQVDAVATVGAPEGRHRLLVVARPGGHTVLAVRYDELSLSRRNVIDGALHRRGWDVDEDGEGATRRFPPGTDATTVAFEALAVIPAGGVPPGPRTVTALDGTGRAVPLGPEAG